MAKFRKKPVVIEATQFKGSEQPTMWPDGFPYQNWPIENGGLDDPDAGGQPPSGSERLDHPGSEGGILPLQAGHLRGDVRASVAASPAEPGASATPRPFTGKEFLAAMSGIDLDLSEDEDDPAPLPPAQPAETRCKVEVARGEKLEPCNSDLPCWRHPEGALPFLPAKPKLSDGWDGQPEQLAAYLRGAPPDAAAAAVPEAGALEVKVPASLLRSLLSATCKWWQHAASRYMDGGGIEWAGEACAGETWAQGSRLLRKAEVRALSSPSGDARPSGELSEHEDLEFKLVRAGQAYRVLHCKLCRSEDAFTIGLSDNGQWNLECGNCHESAAILTEVLAKLR